MKNYITPDYTFTPGAANTGTVRINLEDFTAKRLIAITNVTRNVIIYAPGLNGAGLAAVSDNVVTLQADTSTHAATDVLQVIYDIGESRIETLLRWILQMLMAPLGYDKSLQRYRQTTVIESGTVTTVSTVTTVTGVTTVSTVSNLSTIDNLQGRIMVLGINNSAWADCHRSRIS